MKGWILWVPFNMPLKLFLFKYNPKKVARYFVFPSVKKWAEKWKKVPHNYIKDVTLFSTDYVTSKKSSQKGRSLDRRHASSLICKEKNRGTWTRQALRTFTLVAFMDSKRWIYIKTSRERMFSFKLKEGKGFWPVSIRSTSNRVISEDRSTWHATTEVIL